MIFILLKFVAIKNKYGGTSKKKNAYMGVPVSQFYSGENIITCSTFILIDETCKFTRGKLLC